MAVVGWLLIALGLLFILFVLWRLAEALTARVPFAGGVILGPIVAAELALGSAVIALGWWLGNL